MNKKEKLDKLQAMSGVNPDISITQNHDDSVSVFLSSRSKTTKIDLTDNFSKILYDLNDFLFTNNVAVLGNFGEYGKQKLQTLTDGNPNITILSDGNVFLENVNITITVNLFHSVKLIVQNVNKTIADIEKGRKVKIGKIKI